MCCYTSLGFRKCSCLISLTTELMGKTIIIQYGQYITGTSALVAAAAVVVVVVVIVAVAVVV